MRSVVSLIALVFLIGCGIKGPPQPPEGLTKPDHGSFKYREKDKKKGTRKPNQAELMMFANMCVEHKANPYLKECWLVHMRGHYEPIIAAQVRVRKAQAQTDYDGYTWGWILQDGTRCEPGKASKALAEGIIGVWGEVKRKNVEKPWYHEVFLNEYKTSQKAGSTWGDRPLTMILKV